MWFGQRFAPLPKAAGPQGIFPAYRPWGRCALGHNRPDHGLFGRDEQIFQSDRIVSDFIAQPLANCNQS
jgi:hypothetical protein